MTDSPSAPAGSASCRTPLGWVWVQVRAGAIRALAIQEREPHREGVENELARRACRAIRQWLEGGEWPRGLPLSPEGTDFQLRVWSELLKIPPGRPVTYGELAQRVGSGPRAVGGACRANPIPLLIPCHRVVAATGLGGFAGHRQGAWPAMKRWLLEHEGMPPDAEP